MELRNLPALLLLTVCLPLSGLVAQNQVLVQRIMVERFAYTGPPKNSWLAFALRERTIHNLKNIQQIENISVADQEKVLGLFDHILKKTDSLAAGRVLSLALNARYVLSGSVRVDGDTIRIDYRILLGKKFDVLKIGTLHGTLIGLSDLQNRLPEEIIHYLDTEAKTIARVGEPGRRHFTETPAKSLETYRLYGRGLEIEKKDPGEALRLYRGALDREPRFEEAVFQAARNHEERTEFHEALRLYERRLELLNDRRKRNTRFFAETLLRMGDVHRQMKNNDLALKSFREGNQILESIGLSNTEDYSTTVTSIGEIFKEKGEYETALENFRQSKAIKDRLELNLTFNYTNLLNNMGTVFFILNNFEDALTHFDEELKLKRALGLQNTVAFADTLNNVGVIYMNRGKTGDLTLARKNYDASLELRQQIGDTTSLGYANNLYNMGYMFATYYRDPCGATTWLRKAVRVLYGHNPDAVFSWLDYLNLQVKSCREQLGS